MTADTTIIVYGTNKDETGKPAASLETEIKTLTGYDTAKKLQDKMGSKKGKKLMLLRLKSV